jgi:hypothetical protein
MSQGMMKGAHPTAPGGMSQKGLVEELVTKHGFEVEYAQNLAWPDQIEAVAEQRRAREDEQRCWLHETINCAECSGEAKAHDESLSEAAAMFDSPVEADDSDFDPDDLMAELTSTRDEHEAEVRANSLLITEPGTLNYIFNGHAGAGPSSSERWLSCTASLGASREFLETLTPNQQQEFAGANSAARQGTVAHSAAEVEARVILGEMTQEEADLTLLELAVTPEVSEAYDEEMAEYIVEYVDLVKSYVQDRGNEHVLVEHRVSAAVPLTEMHDGEVYEITGSADFIALPTPEEPVLVVGDLKYGSGIWVGVDENSQAMIYALGALAECADPETGQLPEWLEEVVLHIIQPRMDGIKTATMTVDDLLDWRDEVLAPALTKALYGVDEGATFVPSEGACQFCPARGGCAALAEDRMARATEFFDAQVEAEFETGPGTFLETGTLTDTRLGELLAQITGLIEIHKDLKAEAERRLYRGDSVPGFQLVNYSPPRKWRDGAEEALAEDENLWARKLITPTAAEKLLGEEYSTVEALVDKPDKRPVVAKVGDRRSVWQGKPPEAMFADESGDE